MKGEGRWDFPGTEVGGSVGYYFFLSSSGWVMVRWLFE